MQKINCKKLIKLPDDIFYNIISNIALSDRQVELEKKPFIAIGLEKSRSAKDWEDTDYFNIIVLTQGKDQKYYTTSVEHPADVFSPKYVEDERNIHEVEDIKQSTDGELIDNLYSLVDSRDKYTITVADKIYSIYEKYLAYKISVGYEIWESHDKSIIGASPFLVVRCELPFLFIYIDNIFKESPPKILKYQIFVLPLLRASILNFRPFEVWDGDIDINGSEVILKSQ